MGGVKNGAHRTGRSRKGGHGAAKVSGGMVHSKASKKRRLHGSSKVTTIALTSQYVLLRRRNEAACGPGLDAIDDFAAMRALASNGGNSAALRQMEVYEWIGDAVIGELVARCLLSQFHRAPLSARVFRNLRLGVVTNQNLATVFDIMGYQRQMFVSRQRKIKEKADVVEAIAGELVVRLEQQKEAERVCRNLRVHLDSLVACMLHQHFAERRRVHQRAVITGPLAISFNAFACLPQEYLDEDTGELLIDEGSTKKLDEQITIDSGEASMQDKSIAALLEECEYDDKARPEDSSAPFHLFNAAGKEMPLDEWRLSAYDGDTQAVVASIRRRVLSSQSLLASDHVLRSSREIFDVFKIYGMAVMAERTSLALAFPHLALRMPSSSGRSVRITPSSLTTQRQSVLSMANLADCAILLGIGVMNENDRVSDDLWMTQRLRANSLRAFVGYHSAIASSDGEMAIADDVVFLLQVIGGTSDRESCSRYPQLTPRREPLSVLNGAVSVATDFMSCQVCDDLHQPGERPKPTPVPRLLIRPCDSTTPVNLFDELAKRRELEQQQKLRRSSEDGEDTFVRRRKRKHSAEAADPTSKGSANLARFVHRRFLFCLEELVVLFAQRKTEECRMKMALFGTELEPCAGDLFRKWEVSTSTLTLAMRDSFYRLLLHDLCNFHALVSTSKNTRDGTRITQLRLPMHYTWTKVGRRITTEDQATG